MSLLVSALLACGVINTKIPAAQNLPPQLAIMIAFTQIQGFGSEKEWIDYIAPQLYWRQDSKLGPYNELVDWWVSEVKSTKVKLYIGQALFMLGTRYWQNPKEIINQIHYNRKKQRVDGTIF